MQLKSFIQYLKESESPKKDTIGHYIENGDSRKILASLLSLSMLSDAAVRILKTNGYELQKEEKEIDPEDIIYYDKPSNQYQLKSIEPSETFTKYTFFVDPLSRENRTTFTVGFPKGSTKCWLYVNPRLRKIEDELNAATEYTGRGTLLPEELIKKYNLKTGEDCGCHVHTDAFVPIYIKPVIININGRDIIFYNQDEEEEARKILRPYGLKDGTFGINPTTAFDSKFKGWHGATLFDKENKPVFTHQ